MTMREKLAQEAMRAIYTVERDYLPIGTDKNQVAVDPKIMGEAIVDAILNTLEEPTPHMMERGIVGRHETLATVNVWKDMVQAIREGA